MTDPRMTAALAAKRARDLADVEIWRTVHGHNHIDTVPCRARCPRTCQMPAETIMLMKAAYGRRPRTVIAP